MKQLKLFSALLMCLFALSFAACGDDDDDEYTVILNSGILNGYKWVDLGLSVKWATCNVGANSPEEYGDYFAWGETSPKTLRC